MTETTGRSTTDRTLRQDAALRAKTGIPGLDHVLDGGFPRHRMYLLEGRPGVGKTTVALEFLREGQRNGERGLYVTLSETEEELRQVAASHGWSLEGIDVFELLPAEGELSQDAQQTMFHPSEIELHETVQALLARVAAVQPARLALDSLSELRLLAQNALRYRRQILALKHYFRGRGCTVLLLDDRSAEDGNDLQDLKSLVHGAVLMEHMAPDYGGDRRRLRVLKMRGVPFRGGYHDFAIHRGGVRLFPRLVAQDEARQPLPANGEASRSEHAHAAGDHDAAGQGMQLVSSGEERLDRLLGGGYHLGTSTLLMGPAGSGKSALATLCVVRAAQAGMRSAIYGFDESRQTSLQRARSLSLPLEPHLRSGCVTLTQIDPAELSAGEFAERVRRAVEDDGVRIVVIDSLNGYMNAMAEQRHLNLHMHELLTYLAHRGVLALLLVAQHGVVGPEMFGPVDVTYLADSVLMLRYFEAGGEVRRSIAVVKKRTGGHERAIRELEFVSDGIRVGPALRQFRGLLTGVPEYLRDVPPPLGSQHDDAADGRQ